MDPNAGPEFWQKVLAEGHPPLRFMHKLFRYLPGPPRCKVCHNPFGGIGGKLVGLFGFTPSRKNPNVCVVCCEKLPPGGAEADIAVLFADVRGSTALAERLTATAFSDVMRGFYARATGIVERFDGTMDKFIGDGVVALFLGDDAVDHARRAIDAAHALVTSLDGEREARPWPPVAVGVHTGTAWLGLIPGPHGTDDLTALGDSVNVAAHLCAAGAPARSPSRARRGAPPASRRRSCRGRCASSGAGARSRLGSRARPLSRAWRSAASRRACDTRRSPRPRACRPE